MRKQIDLIKVCSDLGAGTRGASHGAETLLFHAQKNKNSLLKALPVKTCYSSLSTGFTSPHTKSIEQVYTICQSIGKEVCNTLVQGKTPVVISGDHSCAAGTIAGIKMARRESRLGVVWIDAHADIHSPYTTPSGNMHGMPLAASLDENNLDNASHLLDKESYEFWEKFKNMGGISPKIRPEDIVYVSLRDLEKEERALIGKHGIMAVSTSSLRRSGLTYTVGKIFSQLEKCTDIYVSFDTDSLEGSLFKGTGLPVTGGLLPAEAEWLIAFLLGNPKVTCFEITEFNPFRDKDKQTQNVLYRILENAVATLQKQVFAKRFVSEPDPGWM